MGASNNAPSIWEYLTSSDTSDTKLQIKYTKNDDRVATLSVILKDSSGNTIGSQDIDVSSQSKGSSSSYQPSINNNLSAETYNATQDSVSVNAGSSTTYTVPSGKVAVILAQSAGCQIKVGSDTYPFKNDVVVDEGNSVTINNPTSDNVTVTVYLIDKSSFTFHTFTVEFQEKDSNGNVLYDYSINITDVAPLSLNVESEGSVSVDYVG